MTMEIREVGHSGVWGWGGQQVALFWAGCGLSAQTQQHRHTGTSAAHSTAFPGGVLASKRGLD